MPVRDDEGWLYGFTARSLTGQKPKTLSFIEDSRGAWYSNTESNDLIIVEDQLSAIRCSEYINAVALLGTAISIRLAKEIAENKFDTVYLVLDKDAYSKALGLGMDFPGLNMKIPMTTKDMKDMEPEQLRNWLAVNCGVTKTYR